MRLSSFMVFGQKIDVVVFWSLLIALVSCWMLAQSIPMATSLVGLALFGILHNILEIKYLILRFGMPLRSGRLGWILVGSICMLLSFRMVAVGVPALANIMGSAEIIASYFLLGIFVIRAQRNDPTLGIIGVLVLGVMMFESLYYSDWHFVVLSHVHNLIPLLFIFSWSRSLESGFRPLVIPFVLWAIVLPAAIFMGYDRGMGNLDKQLVSAVTPYPIERILPVMNLHAEASGTGWRFLRLYSFLQTMHYFVWIIFFPMLARGVRKERHSDLQVVGISGYIFWGIGTGLAVVGLASLFFWDYPSGKTVYQIITTVHVYGELPVVMLLLIKPDMLLSHLRSTDPASGVDSTGSLV